MQITNKKTTFANFTATFKSLGREPKGIAASQKITDALG